MTEHIVVLVTVPVRDTGEQIAAALLDRKLAAAVNIVPSITSFYTWQGQRESHTEVLLIIKSRADLFEDKLVPAIQEIHPYDVPQIIALPILAGSQSYLDWIDEVTE